MKEFTEKMNNLFPVLNNWYTWNWLAQFPLPSFPENFLFGLSPFMCLSLFVHMPYGTGSAEMRSIFVTLSETDPWVSKSTRGDGALNWLFINYWTTNNWVFTQIILYELGLWDSWISVVWVFVIHVHLLLYMELYKIITNILH